MPIRDEVGEIGVNSKQSEGAARVSGRRELLATTMLTGLALTLPAAALAETTKVKTSNATVDLPTIDVEGRPGPVEGRPGPLNLDVPDAVGSLVGLTPRETPATVNIITQKDMQQKGLRDLIEVFNSVPGITSGNNPGEPAAISVRGFSRAVTGYSIDGVRAVDPLLVVRNYDTFNFERVEILKGPASVIQGTGALAGAVNLVTKQPWMGGPFAEGLLSYGSFNALRAGVGANVPIGPNAAVRSTLSYAQSDGYIDDTNWRTIGLTTGGVLALSDSLTLSGSVDYFHDDFRTPYEGLPLIGRAVARAPTDIVSAPNNLVADRSIRYQNYDVYDSVMKSDTLWLRGGAEYKLTDNWSLKNELSYFTADRYWANSDSFLFNSATGLLDRSATLITHDHHFWSERATARYDGIIGGFHNRFAAGLEYVDTAFGSIRRFGTTTPVNPFNPIRGFFPADTPANFPTRQNFDSRLTSVAVFAEDAINLMPNWLVLAGIRHDTMKLDREIDDLNRGAITNFDRTFQDLSWRVGTVYDVVPGTALFAQYTEAAVPVATLLLSNTANGQFELSTGSSVEGGIKSSLWNNRVVGTVSIYQIELNNILTRDPLNPVLTVQGGSQQSRGIELDLWAALTDQWTFGGNASFIDAEFTSLRDATRDLRGNRPFNVPAEAYMLWTSYRFEQVPLTVGTSIKHVGSFYTDTTNTIEVKGHTLLEAWLAYDIGGGTLRLRGRNLTNAFYADWSGYSPTQVYLGAPRSFDIAYNITF
jgi:iron complex outermembrane receptor protein